MADRKEWKEQLLSKLLDQYEKSVTYAGENKVKQVFSVKPSDIFKGYNKDFLPPEQLFQEKEFERLIRQMESEGLIHVVPPNIGILRQICAVPERWEDYYACLNRTEKNILKKRLEEVYHRFRQCDLLEAYGKEKLPAYIYLKGDARICLEDGRELRIYHDLPMSIPFETFQKAKSIQIRDAALMTVENLTSFHRLEREHIFYLFLSGYHTRTKQALLQRIARENPGLSWHHFGDLDPDGLAIAGHLIRKTGLPFQLCAMGVQELQRFQTYAKPLEAPDRAKAEAMIKQGSSYAGILRYMLEHNCKLEQEIISWQETRLESFL